MALNGVLTIGTTKWEILDVKYGFSRPVDEKRRPTTGGQSGGLINITVETNDDNTFIDKFKYNRAFECKVEIFSGRDQRVVRCLEYEEVYLVGIEEMFSSRVGVPMLTRITLSPTKMKLHGIPLTRRWPEVQGFWWEVKEDKPVTYAKTATKSKARITDAYWLDENGNKNRFFNVSHPVTLYLILEDYVVGDVYELDFDDTDNMSSSKYSGIIDENGIVKIEKFIM